MAARRRAGFTIIEVLLAIGLIGLVLANISMLLRSSASAYSVGASATELDLQADRTLDRIALAIMGASAGSLNPTQQAPFFTPSLDFQQNLGVARGEVVYGAPERISFVVEDGVVTWRENPGQESERLVVWTRWVRDFLAGEVPNGVDDNGNGLIDERGLAFTLEGNLVTIRLTLERPGPDGRLLTEFRETSVTCRN
ncbi:MAG TPA: prepilin-type N-terminal cleavage/methylation domain-containing protein [Candidatus Limnocylindrales bacterium]|nr:prepilin-type N-terminal cleavage/methylation domain-containing protein [Candidatus Limnocylindrales bacterium]